MYMQDGKSVIPYGRKSPGVNKIEFNELVERLEIAEAKIAKLESQNDPQDGDKPKRGPKPKGATK